MTTLHLLNFIFVLVLRSNFIYCDHTLIQKVKTSNGVVQGYEYSDSIIGYTGIPYAQAPIENLRFETPKEFISQNEDVINNKEKETVLCSQITVMNGISEITGEEDCLYMSIYTPKEKNPKEKYPVLFYIHGGGFTWGTGTIFKPDYLLRDQNVILVTFNYRLNALGFLSAGLPGDELIRANNGLKDQSLALKWVHKNIEYFGGDNSKITIFGNSAGGASSHLQLFTPKSTGLFHSAILQSGYGFCPWALKPYQETHKFSQEFARLMQCPILPTIEMINCLKEKPVEEILNTMLKLFVFHVDPMILFHPAIEPYHEDAFITDSLENLIKRGEFNDVPVLVGSNTDEGILRTSYFTSNPDTYEKFDQHFNDLFRTMIFRPYLTTNQVKQVRKYYFGDKKIGQESLKELTKLLTDTFFICSETSIDHHRKYAKSPVYSYLLTYKGALSFTSVFGKNEMLDLGVCHMDELLYLFPLEFFFADNKVKPKQLNEEDVKLMGIMTKIWIHFAKEGNFENLSIPEAKNLKKWDPAASENNEYLTIDQEFKFQMGKNRYGESIRFWENLLNDKQSDADNKFTRNEL